MTALMLTSCSIGHSQREGTEETINQDEAAQKIDQHFTEAIVALPDNVELEPLGPIAFASCDDPTDGGTKGRITVSQRQWLTGLPKEDNEQNVDLFHDCWVSNGYRVIHDLRPDELFVTVESETDAFNVSVQASDEGDLSIGVSSPCVWPEGTPNS
ncbi:hypothetical protein ACFW4K_05255 [Nocardiopsis alba]|uniref:hypothetical protein n=1 Tax=Nocardiopsis alba TaxID=53437 RepID=UPI003670B2C6